MKKINGFTLVELLAVIIILSLLVLLTGNIVTRLVKDSKEDLYDTQIELIKSAAKTWATDNTLRLPSSGECGFLNLSYLKEEDLIETDITNPETNEKFSDDLKIKISSVTNSKGNLIYKYEVNPDSVEGCYSLKPYKDGEVVYYDVERGVSCNNYLEDNSKTGYNGYTNKDSSNNEILKLETQNSCLKFYVFLDNGGKTLNLLLDHNTTGIVVWNAIGSNKNGPKEVLTQLQKDTEEWSGTEEPDRYILDQSLQKNGAKYEINYNNYKARLITAEEVAKITKNIDWNINTSKTLFYFDTLTEYESTVGYKYGWLYDRTSSNCKKYGCLNDSEEKVGGYWTASSSISSVYVAWCVYYRGYLSHGGWGDDWNNNVAKTDHRGARPVIEVSRTNLK